MEIRFGPFVLNHDTRQLTRDGSEVHLSPKAFELLATLVAERPKVLSKGLLRERLWPRTFVASANLSNLIAEVRGALGEVPRAARFVRTSHGFGYAFFGNVTSASPVPPDPSAPWTMSSWLECGGQRFPLLPGANIIGRDSDLPVALNGTTVSRRHARIIVRADGASIEDSGSKNGTFVGGVRVVSPLRLTHGDEIHFGTLLMKFYAHRLEPATETAVYARR